MYYRNGNIYSTLRAYDVIAMKLKSFIFEVDKASGVASNKKEWCMNRGSFGGLGMTFDGTYIWQTTELTNRWVYKILWNPTTSTKSDLQNHPFIVRVSEDKNSLFINDVSKKTGYLALFDFYGREIRYVQAEDGSTLDITTLPPGAYMVQAYSLKREQLARQKFLK